MSTSVARDFPTNARPLRALVSVVKALVLFAVSTSAHAQPLFQPEIQIDAGIRPRVVAIGDLNGDGKPDLVVGNAGPLYYVDPGFFWDSCYVSVRLGNGDGTFGPRFGYRLGNRQIPTQMVISDLNGDGHPDLVVPTRDSVEGIELVWTILGSGNGTFPGPWALYTGGTSIAVADLNGDARPDLVITSQASLATNTVAVRLGNGDGTFAAATPFTTGATPRAVAIADFNHDDLPDLATANYSAGSISILRGLGGGTFAPKIDYPTGTGPWAIAVEDLNHDDRPDVAVLTWNPLNAPSAPLPRL